MKKIKTGLAIFTMSLFMFACNANNADNPSNDAGNSDTTGNAATQPGAGMEPSAIQETRSVDTFNADTSNMTNGPDNAAPREQ